MAGIASSVGGLVIPLIAVTETHANATEMALLGAAGTVPSLLLQIPAAVWADAPSRHGLRTLVLTDVMSCLLSLTVPICWLLAPLSFPLVLSSELLLALVGVARYASQTPVLTSIVPGDELVDANGKLSAARSATDIGGQGLAGLLLTVLAQPFVLVVNAVGYAISAGLLARMPSPSPATRQQLTRGPTGWRGLGPIAARLFRRFDIATYVGVGLVNGVMNAVFMLYATHNLAMPGNVIAWCIGAGALGGVVGGSAAGRLEKWIGARWCVTAGALLVLGSVLPLLLARPGATAIAAVITNEFVGALGGILTIAATYGAILGSTSHDSVSRTMAVISNSGQIAALAGLAIGGYLGTVLTLRAAIGAATIISGLIGLCALSTTTVRRTTKQRVCPRAAD